MFAVISYKGNQYKVEPGKEYKIDLIDDLKEDQKDIVFSEILLLSDDKKVTVGEPTIPKVSIKAEVLGQSMGEKIRVLKFRAKKRYKREQGHREKYTLIKVTEINYEK